MRAPIYTLLIGISLTTGCDDSTTDTSTPHGPSSGTTVQPPPPVTPTTQPTTRPAGETTSDLMDEHKKNHNLPPAPDAMR